MFPSILFRNRGPPAETGDATKEIEGSPRERKECKNRTYETVTCRKYDNSSSRTTLKRQDAVRAYIWAWSYFGYDTLNMPYCS